MLEELDLNPVWPKNPLASTAAASAPALDLATLVAEHSTLLFRVAHSVLRNRPAAEDVVQEAFLRVLHHQADLPGVRELRPWLVRIAWRLALDHRRRLQATHSPSQLDDLFAASLVSPELSPEAALAQTRHLTAVLREIDRLPTAERQILLLTVAIETGAGPSDPTPDTQAQPDVQDISVILGKSPSATRALLFRARTRLRERLSRKGLLP